MIHNIFEDSFKNSTLRTARCGKKLCKKSIVTVYLIKAEITFYSSSTRNKPLKYTVKFNYKTSTKWDLFPQNERQVAKFHLKVISRFMMFRLQALK